MNLKLEGLLETFEVCGQNLDERISFLFRNYFEEEERFSALIKAIKKAIKNHKEEFTMS